MQFSGAVNYTWRLTGPERSDKQSSAATVVGKIDFNLCEKPVGTTAARRSGTQGTVVIIYTMEVDGRITDAMVERSSGRTREHKQLDRATLEAVKACKGIPTTVNGTDLLPTSRNNLK